MVSWDKVCRPKKAGGLGLRKMEVVNSAFLKKLTYKLFYGESLWVEQMQGKYPIDENFFSLEPKKSYSWAWKCILKNRPEF